MKSDMPGFWENTDSMFRVRWVNAVLAIGERASGTAGNRMRCDEHGDCEFQHDQPFVYRVLFGHFVKAMRRISWSERLIALFDAVRKKNNATMTAAQFKLLETQMEYVTTALGTLSASEDKELTNLSSMDKNIIVEALCKSIGLQTVALSLLGQPDVHYIMEKKMPLVFPHLKDQEYHHTVARVIGHREVVDV